MELFEGRETEKFEIIIGINPGYFHNNEINKNGELS